MDKSTFIIMILSLSLFLAPRTQAQPEAQSGARKTNTPTITVTGLEVTDRTLTLRYDIKNDSAYDIWVCEDVDVGYALDFEVHLAEDGQTLLIRRRLDVPMEIYRNPATARYIRLRASETLTESLLLPVPIRPRLVFLGARKQKAQGTVYAKRLMIEIGFYSGDLYGTVLGMLEEAEKTPRRKPHKYSTDILHCFGGSPLYFTRYSESVRDRDEQVQIPWTNQTLKGEQVLQTTVADLHIPYEEIRHFSKLYPPDLSRCTRVEIRYQPSMLGYFFPHASHQRLLNASETENPQFQKKVVVDDRERIEAFANEISKGLDGGAIITSNSTAQVVCYCDDELLTSFTAYDEAIETEEKQRFRFQNGLLNIMRILTPQIKPFELRVRCATNLKNLWYRLRLYNKSSKRRSMGHYARSRIVYPIPAVWCHALVEAYQITGPKYSIMRLHKCPSAGEGKCHYAMNPDCRANSLPDTVLLFETKAGWNQHGGPELFTFDNHEPRGGCVLLNDGTVEFIRTTEELQKLRWK